MLLGNLFGPDLGYVVIILLAVVLGGSQLPKMARNLGLAGKEFRKAQDEAEKEKRAEDLARTTHEAPSAVTTGSPDDRVTLSKAELEALLDEREAKARNKTS